MMARTLAARLPWVRTTPLGREVEPLVNWRKAVSSSVTFAGRSSSRMARTLSTATTLASSGTRAWMVPSMRLISVLVSEQPGAAAGHDVQRVVEVAGELAEAGGRVDRHGHQAGAEGAEEGEDEVGVVGEDERHPIAPPGAERLEGAAVAGARPLDAAVGEEGLGVAATLAASSMKRYPVLVLAAASSMAWTTVRGAREALIRRAFPRAASRLSMATATSATVSTSRSASSGMVSLKLSSTAATISITPSESTPRSRHQVAGVGDRPRRCVGDVLAEQQVQLAPDRLPRPSSRVTVMRATPSPTGRGGGALSAAPAPLDQSAQPIEPLDAAGAVPHQVLAVAEADGRRPGLGARSRARKTAASASVKGWGSSGRRISSGARATTSARVTRG